MEAGIPSVVTGSFGFLVLDKPAGLTSHDCVARVRRAYGLRRVGHGGTLDPAVTGVLPIAVGPATRLLPYLPSAKAYEGTIRLGIRTDSDDLEGTILATRPVPPLDALCLEAVLERFRGRIRQRPPDLSAVHVQGERAYALARRGETPDLAAREVTIHALELAGWDPPGSRIHVRVHCSAGTYIRSLARDLGEALGCGAALERLRRSEALGFTLDDAIPLARLDVGPPPPLRDPLDALGHLPRQHLSGEGLAHWRCGRALPAETVHHGDQPVVVLTPEGHLAGIARATATGHLQPRLVLDAAG